MLLRRLVLSRRAVAGIEFALVLPVMLILVLGGYEITRAVGASIRVTYLANGLAEFVSQTTLEMTDREFNRILETAPLLDPDIIGYARQTRNLEFWKVAEIIVSSVEFKPLDPSCKTGCVYEGDMIFSRAHNKTPRSCGKAAAAALLPPEVAGTGSLIVIEVVVPYKAAFANIAVLPLSFKRKVYLRPRYVERIESVWDCPGF